MKKFILVTGATSGIGYEMARQLAEKKYNLILVARSTNKLAQMQTAFEGSFGIEVHYFDKDLTMVNEAVDLFDSVIEKKLQVSHLVNNAGFGDYGSFLETDLVHEIDMINLNISSLVVLTKLFAKDMAKRGEGRIMNVASLLSFIPFPYYSVYSSTKAFVLAFTETVAAELEGMGIVVTALCPGTVETGFHTPEMRRTNAMHANRPVPPEVVARAGTKLLLYGKGKKIVGWNNWFISNLPRITPDSLMMKIKKYLASAKT
ncbi:MAG: SDR family oxidoreductase [Chitinophagaceae bacterium]|nr:SDR family oxidoreductase [Chitinophagaceae bacterium]